MDSQSKTLFNSAEIWFQQIPVGSRIVLLVLFCYLLFRIPIAAEYYNYHSDEAYFTDNALEMMLRGDYVTSFHGGDETPRFDKPPPTAWCVVLGFKLFGISVLSSRIVFLLIGAAIVWITYRFAKRLLEDETQAALAAIILVTNVTYLYHVGYALTDGLLTLGVLMTHIGIAEMLLFKPRQEFEIGDTFHLRPRREYATACIYLGLLLALFTKGIIALPPMAFAFIFGTGLFFAQRRRKIRLPLELFNVPWAVVAILPLSWWMWVEYQRYGIDALTGPLHRGSGGFLQDQFLRRTERTQALTNMIFYPTNMIQTFLPWTLPLFLLFTRHRRALIEEVKKKKVVYAFLLGSCLFEYLFFSPVNINRSRYMMPIYPLFSIFLASWLMTAARVVQMDRFWRKLAIALAAFSFAGGGILIALSSRISERALISGILFVLGAVLLIYWAVRQSSTLLPALGIFILFAWSAFDYFEMPIFAQAPAADVTRLLEEHNLTKERLWLGHEIMYELAPQLRVTTHGTLTYRFLFEHPEEVNPKVALMKEGKAEPALSSNNYQIFPAGLAYVRRDEPLQTPFFQSKVGRAIDEELFFYYVLKGDYQTFVEKYRSRYLLAIRRDGEPQMNTDGHR